MPIISYQFNYLAFILCILTKVVHSLPHDKCFEKFDGRDCHQPPKQVFYYYKEGSRCEMKTWRGCPSLNMFDDEFACSHHCIGKLWRRGSGEEGFGHSESEEIDPCSQTLDTADCGLEPQEVYTFQGGICETENWYGCTSHNKFEDEASCIKACVTTVAEWKEELNSLDLPEIEDIGTILDDVINEADRIPLHLSVVEHDTETTSEPETTPEPEITPEPETTPEPEITPEPETTPEPEITPEPETTPEPEITPEPETKDESKSSSGEGPIAQGSIEEVVT